MRKVILLLLFAPFSLFVITPSFSLARVDQSETVSEEETTLEGSGGALVEEKTLAGIDSFELFWPIVAGKTRGDSLFFLKRFKEKFRGALIFSSVKKAGYETLIATKRVVEAEKLLKEGDVENAKESLKDAVKALDEVQENWESLDDKGDSVKSEKDEINNKLNNLTIFLPYLANKYEESSSFINETLDKVKSVDDII